MNSSVLRRESFGGGAVFIAQATPIPYGKSEGNDARFLASPLLHFLLTIASHWLYISNSPASLSQAIMKYRYYDLHLPRTNEDKACDAMYLGVLGVLIWKASKGPQLDPGIVPRPRLQLPFCCIEPDRVYLKYLTWKYHKDPMCSNPSSLVAGLISVLH